MELSNGETPSITEIMQICDVSRRTAQRWLSGETQPPRPMKRLMELEMSGRIMPDRWPHYWRFSPIDRLETETCHDALRWQDITWYSYVIAAWQESLALIPKIEASIDYLMDKLPQAEIIILEEYRRQLQELHKQGKMSALDVVNMAAEHHEKEVFRKYGC